MSFFHADDVDYEMQEQLDRDISKTWLQLIDALKLDRSDLGIDSVIDFNGYDVLHSMEKALQILKEQQS